MQGVCLPSVVHEGNIEIFSAPDVIFFSSKCSMEIDLTNKFQMLEGTCF